MSVDGRQWVLVGTTSRAITAYGGAELLRETMRVVGLEEAVAEHVRLKSRARGLSEAQFVLARAESIALGARCLDDLATSRGDAAQGLLRGFAVPTPQTAGTWLRRFSLGHIRQLDKALMHVQRNAFRAAGVTDVTLEFDSTYVFSRTKRRQDDQVRCFAGVAAHLAPGGVFVVEAFVPDPTRSTFGQNTMTERVDVDTVLLTASRHDPVRQVVESQHVVIGERGTSCYPVTVRYAWPAELDLMARLAGLRLRERWGGWQREPFGAASTNHVSVYEQSPGITEEA